MAERSLAYVPRVVLVALIAALALQVTLKQALPAPAAAASDLGPAPSLASMRLVAFGDPIPLAKLLMLTLQAFDYQAGSQTPYQALDYERLAQWLELILRLDPSGQYPLLAASRVYADVPDESKQRAMLDFVYRQFRFDPDRRWPWLAHAAAIAKHRLKDLELARRYAAAIQQHAKGPNVPLWAKQMEIFILEDMNELETARIMIGGFLASGSIKDPAEIRFLDQRLREIEARLKGTMGKPKS
ncbi:MAG: hypothetical protein HYU75_23585 [Betaproteobacteria bacterium]|nr:hypothetical protein [Betaproteobacteria bacterium]